MFINDNNGDVNVWQMNGTAIDQRVTTRWSSSNCARSRLLSLGKARRSCAKLMNIHSGTRA
jgi:hypothetical protein